VAPQEPRNGIEAAEKHIQSSPPMRTLFENRPRFLGEPGWEHWARHERQWLLLRLPPNCPRF
jgi:hypothetical protein